MKSTDYKVWLERHQLTHEAAGKALGVHKSTSKRYASGNREGAANLQYCLEVTTP